eukprot:EG_transcript_37225
MASLLLLLLWVVAHVPGGRAGPLGTEYRSWDGFGNNRRYPGWGASDAALLRFPPYRPRYGADNSSLATGLPNPRAVSQAISAVSRKLLNPRLLSDMHTSWGHFIGHDVTLTYTGVDEAAPIPVPPCDPDFDPGCTGNASIPFIRSRYVLQDGVRQQLNEVNSFLDASTV